MSPAPLNAPQPLPDDFWQRLMATPWRYDLFQLLRQLDARSGERYALGRAPAPRFEPVRIGQQPSMAFAPTTIAAVKAREGTPLYDISILSFGLFGPNGPLPLHLTEYARERIAHHQDDSLSAFTDIFHHRLTLLFYRAWADAQPTVSQDRTDNRRFEQYIAALAGMGLPGQLANDRISPHARFTHAGHLSRHGRDAEGLEKILCYYFRVPVRLVQNVAQWLAISPREQARLGAARHSPRLGESTFLGQAVRDVQHKFRLELGPLDFEDYQRFLPGSAWVMKLRDWVRQYLGTEFAWELRLILRADAVPAVTPGSTHALGYSTWLGHQPTPVARGDLVFSPETTQPAAGG